MAGMSFDDYLAMVQDTPVPSELIEFRTPDDQLYGVCLTDPLDDGLSLVYSFFDPDVADDSPGKCIILWHIAEGRRRGVPYVYLGYWIEESRKMARQDPARQQKITAGSPHHDVYPYHPVAPGGGGGNHPEPARRHERPDTENVG